jgi:hypothetical protein
LGYSGYTAAEIIVSRVDNSKPNMGLTSWRGNKVRKNGTVKRGWKFSFSFFAIFKNDFTTFISTTKC